MFASALLIAAGCGDSDGGTKTDGGGGGGGDTGGIQLDGGGGNADLGVSDQGVKPDVGDSGTAVCDKTKVGLHCTQNGGECGSGMTCLLTSQTRGGVCTCLCTPDNPNTPLVNEDSCPDPTKNLCGNVSLSDGTSRNFCFTTCQPKLGANDCNAPLACSPRSASSSGRIDKAVCINFGCEKDTDCPVTTGTICDTAKNPTGCQSGEECLPLTTSGTQGICAKPGKCDTKSGLCDAKPGASTTAKVGDPCKADADCGAYMDCQVELDRKTLLGQKDHGAACSSDDDCCGTCESGKCEGTCKIDTRGGYCAVRGCAFATATDYKEFACPTGSSCNNIFFGGICMKDCAMDKAGDCRGNANDKYGDYECYSWDQLSIGGVQVSAKPVCSFSIAPCDLFGATSSLDCTSIGAQGNPTQMVCRNLSTKQPTTNPKDPSGFCLDNTASGN